MTFLDSDPDYLTKVHDLITMHFNEEELRTLCLNLGMDYENLSGKGKKAKARELILKLDRLDRIDDLKKLVIEKRPLISWPDKSQGLASEGSPNLHKSKDEGSLSINVISSHAGPDAWNQGEPLSPFQFVIKLDLANQSPKPIILKSFEISTFEASHERLNQSVPIGALSITDNNNRKVPINIFPYQIQGEYFGLMEYKIKIPLDDRNRLKFVPDSDMFQKFTIKLSYEYHDMTHVNHIGSFLVEGAFNEFKDAWREQYDLYQRNLLR